MKRINFKSIKIQNLLSIGNDPVQINFKKGINFITGINKDKNNRRNGTGKSTILTGIFWGLFGENDRNIKNEFLVNNITKSKTYVEINFEVIKNDELNSYKIIRTLKPSSCLLYENGKDVTLSSIANTNSKIIEIISSTPEMFQNCLIMSLNDTIPFMAKKEIDKRKFIEQIFNLEFFNKMLLDIRNDFNNKKKEKDIQDVILNEKQILLKSDIKQKENYDIKILQNIAKTKNKIKDIDVTIENLQKEKNRLEQIYQEALKELKKEAKSLSEIHQNMNKSSSILKKAQSPESPLAQSPREFQVGEKIRYGKSKGVIKGKSGSLYLIECDDGFKLKVKAHALKPYGNTPTPTAPKTKIIAPKNSVGISLDLHGLRSEEALERADKFISDCLLAGYDEVLIYHGIGSGILSKVIKDFLSTHPKVVSFSDAPPQMGGFGAKVVRL